MFGLSTQMAMNPGLEKRLYPQLVKAYKQELSKSAPKLYMDKSHPNIWLAEKLKASFPRALFIGIERNPYATVASMMKHKGVTAWHSRWREFPVPNRFLGISATEAEGYENIPIASQCAMRWLAHHSRMSRLENILGVNTSTAMPDSSLESLHKRESQLSNEEIEQIKKIVGFSPDTIK